MVGIIDYGVGNLFSLRSSFEAVGEQAFVSGDPEALGRAARLILPGVGAFGDAAAKLRESGLDRFVQEQAAAGKPLMGICLGMQLLFEKGYEYGEHEGLGLLRGAVVPMKGVLPAGLKIPHIGWNALHFRQPECPIFKNIRERLQKQVSPFSIEIFRLSRFIYASVRTLPLSPSTTMAGIRPF